MKGLGLTIIMLISLISISYSQKENTSEKDVYDAREIIFYGYDYTHFRLADAKRIGQDINKFLFLWTGHCQKRITEKKMTSWLKKDKVTFNFDPTFTLNKELNSDDLVAVTKHSISKDSIQSFIYDYKLTEKEGIGFVVILECFDNASKRTSGYFTFFDIATKQVLMSDYISSRDGNSYNHVLDWGAALVIAFKKYLKVYEENNKLHKGTEN